MIIRRKSEVGSDATVGEDDSSSFEHVEAVGRRWWWTGFRELKGDQGRVVVWEFGAGIRVRFWVKVWFGIRIIGVGFGFGLGGRFSVGGGGRCGGGGV